MVKVALEGVLCQETAEIFSFEVIVVDNDKSRSAESVVKEIADKSNVHISYDCEPDQNIALARNRCLRNSSGTFIAFMDDDEAPDSKWLLNLLSTRDKFGGDGVLGPVRPIYTKGTPEWLRKSRLCERPSHKTGTVLNWPQTRTGNVLFKRSILDGVEVPFAPDRGRTGGEDIDFFRRMMAKNCKFVWCEEAPVYELIEPQRLRRAFYLNKALRMGGLTGELYRRAGLERWKCIWRSGYSATFYILVAFIGLLLGQHIFMKGAVKLTYHFSRIGGCFGFVPVRERREM